MVPMVEADVLVAMRQRTWDPPTAVAQAYIAKDVEDRTGYIIVTDPQGKRVQINRQLVVALFELPELKPPTSVLKAYELGQFTSLQATLAKLNAASPKIKIALAPYQDKFDAVVKPEIDKFQSGNVKINGVWMTREKHEADLAAIAKAEQIEREREAARELAIQRENERKEAARAEQERLAEIRRSEEEGKERETRAVRNAEAKKIADAEAAKIAEAEQARERRASSGSTLNGYTWRTASLETRMRFCNACAARVQSRKPGITGNFIFDSLQEFYNSDDPKILRQPSDGHRCSHHRGLLGVIATGASASCLRSGRVQRPYDVDGVAPIIYMLPAPD